MKWQAVKVVALTNHPAAPAGAYAQVYGHQGVATVPLSFFKLCDRPSRVPGGQKW